MSTTYETNHAAPARQRRRWSRKQVAVATAIGAVLVAPGAAWAAYQLFGFGEINAAAAVTQNLTVANESAQLTKKLVPGQTVGAKAVVNNPNDFPVTVTEVLVRDSSLAVVPAVPADLAACQQSVHVVGTPGASWPGGSGTATKQAIAEPVVIAPGESKWITVPNAVRQDASATKLCGIKAEFAVVGNVGE